MRHVMLTAAMLCWLAASAPAADMKAARKAAADRPRPLIFNNDGNEVVYLMKQPTAEDFLSRRTAPLAGSGVSSIFFVTWSSPFGNFTHHTKVGELFDTTEGLFKPNMTRALFEAGVDPLREVAAWGRGNNVETFWSLRMNDTHDASTHDYGPIMFRASRLKAEHPDWLMGSIDKRPKAGQWSAVDYSRPEVRELAFRYVEEVCRNYDVDGVELDFFRHALFFKTPASGKPATDEELAMMTGLMRRIRAMADDAGAKRGRPILIAMRVPDSIGYARAVGLDLETWLRDDLLDIMVTTSYIQMEPWEHSVALGRKYGVKVYPSLDECRIADVAAKKARSTVETYRARAAAAWAAGVDGIYLFNYFNVASPLFGELHDRPKLATLDKDYFASYRGLGRAVYPHAAFQHAATLNPDRPLKLTAGKPTSVDIHLGAEGGAGNTPAVTLRVLVKDLATPADIAVAFNDQPVTGTTLRDGWLEAPLDPALLKPGRNVVTLTPATGSTLTTWSDLNVRVRYP